MSFTLLHFSISLFLSFTITLFLPCQNVNICTFVFHPHSHVWLSLRLIFTYFKCSSSVLLLQFPNSHLGGKCSSSSRLKKLMVAKYSMFLSVASCLYIALILDGKHVKCLVHNYIVFFKTLIHC